MKVWRNLLIMIFNIINIPLLIISSFGAMWYTLPNIKNTLQELKLGEFILNILNNDTTIFWLTIISFSIFIILSIIVAILGRNNKAKFKNFFIHLNTWLVCLTLIILCVGTFVLTDPLQGTVVDINKFRKIGIGIILLLLIIYHIFSNKIMKIINRRIQAYETAKESNIVGRSSVLFTNLLKLFEILFPEMLVLGLLCFCVSQNIAIYFVVILLSTFIPTFGNIICDLNIRDEIKRNQEIEKDKLAEKIASSINN